MSSDKLFVRDPREVPFLIDQVQKVLVLADESANGIRVREDDDFGFMTIQFLYKQIQHAESVLALIPRRDAGLVARTMIEGLYQLLWTFQAAEERAIRWRSFATIHDWRLIQGRLRESIPVPEPEVLKNAARMKEFASLHRIKKPKPNSTDPYHKSWRGGVTLSDMADMAGRELYDGPYADLSDWEHWGVSGIGEALSRNDEQVTINRDSNRVAAQSLLAAFQCLLQTLEVADVHLSLSIRKKIHALREEFVTTLNSFSSVPKGQDE
jgi:hypothetical protein